MLACLRYKRKRKSDRIETKYKQLLLLRFSRSCNKTIHSVHCVLSLLCTAAAAAVHGVEFVLHSNAVQLWCNVQPFQQLCDLLCASERKVCCLRVIEQSCVSDRVQSVRLYNKDWSCTSLPRWVCVLQLAKANCAILHKFTPFTRLGCALKPKFVQVDTVIEGIKENTCELIFNFYWCLYLK